MKFLKLSPLFFFFLFLNEATLAQGCEDVGTAVTALEAGDVTVYLPNNGNLWTDRSPNAGYITTEANDPNREVSLLFTGGLWMGGYDEGNNLEVAGAAYGAFNGSEDYTPGPLSKMGETSPEGCRNFDRHWSVKKTNIDALLDDLSDGSLDNPVPTELLLWPGKGNPHFESFFGFALPYPDQELAPFIDRDGDGIYDPEKGDTPKIKEADQAVWWVFNDGGKIHEESKGTPLRMEVQVLAYSYNSLDSAINTATFYDYTLINRSINNIDSLFAGIWVDPDFGCFHDDYFGCDPANNLAFVYNEDAVDGGIDCNDCAPGVAGFCEEIPMLGIKVLKGTHQIKDGQVVDNGMSAFAYTNYNINNPAPALILPTNAREYYNYLTGSWRDGTPITYGEVGYDPLSTDFTKYAFPSSPDDPNGWSMCSTPLNASDQTFILSSGPSYLKPSERTQLNFVVFKAYGNNYPCPSLDKLKINCEKIEQFVSSTTSTQDLVQLPASAVNFVPNPMTDYGIIRLVEGQDLLEQVAIYALDGSQLQIANGIQAKEWTVNREGLSAGMYLYRLQTTEGKWFSGKMIVQ